MELTPEEGRVLGALVEKELTTPQGYPLTDNALLAACNQTTSRDPVVSYDLAVLRTAVRSLREQGLLRTVHRPGERSDKHRHELPAALGLSSEQVAVLAVLLLRGPQTAAELRARSERMHVLSGEDVERVLGELAERGLAQRLERQPGRKEHRWAQLLTGPVAEPRAPEPAQVVQQVLADLRTDPRAHLAADAVALAPDGRSALGADDVIALLSADPGLLAGDDLTVGEHAGVVWALVEGGPYRLSLVLVPDRGRHRVAQLHASR